MAEGQVFNSAVYQSTRQAGFAKDFGLSVQLQRAAVSVMANIAEGFERNRFAEFHQFLSVAKASCAEIRSHLYVAFDVGYLNQKRLVGRIVGGLRASLKDRSKSSIHSLSQHPAPSTYEFHSLRLSAL
ncbi:MAG TPA: four helix bundle protein [Nitrospiraceae bacterium]|nr:four helix bundle protein [Nitrospiraceae bacterium]